MKVLVIGDAYIHVNDMLPGFKAWEDRGVELIGIQWDQNGMDMSEINLLLEQHGAEAVEVSDEICALAKDVDCIMTQFCPVNKKLIDAAPNLKAVGTMRAGVENINVDYMTEKGIIVCNNAGRNAHAVSDFTIGMMLAEYRNIARSHAAVKAGWWRKDYVNKAYSPDFEGLTVGIVGFGMIGTLVAKKLAGFDMHILAYDAFPNQEMADKYNVKFVDLNTLMKESDIVSVNCRLIPETYHLVGAEQIALMKPTAILVNTARSGLVDEGALYEALRDHKIGGAALDVFDKEPTTIDYRMIALDNCTVTSHMAGTTIHAMSRSPLRLANHMESMFEGKAPRTWINRSVPMIKFEV